MTGPEVKAREYAQAAHELLEEADRKFGRCNIGQTSEKLWGATAHAIKVCCLHRGWRHTKYAHPRRAMVQMSEETDDDYWMDAFRVAYENHLNIYRDDMNAQDIEDDLMIVSGFVDRPLAAMWDGER